MQRSLSTRLAALEARTSTDRMDTIIVRSVSPSERGPVYHEPIAVKEMRGDWWLDRNPGEDADAFAKRAGEAYPRKPMGVALLMEVYE